MKKQILYAPLTETSAAVTNKVYVSSIGELYEKVNDPANVGKTIVLAPIVVPPWKYSLSIKDPNGQDYPNGGRLELLRNMSLIGNPDHPEDVIIDVTGLTAASLAFTPVATAPIRIGNGNNLIEGLTVHNDPTNAIRALIQTDIVTTPVANIRVAHTILEGASIGLCLINRYAECNNRIIEADIENNEIRNNTVAVDTGPKHKSGIQIQNSHGVTHATIHARLKKNHIHDNGNGLAAFNAAPDGLSNNENIISIKSDEDIFERNGVGIALIGGNSAGGITNDNSTSFDAHDTIIKNNSGNPAPFNKYQPGGVFAAAGLANDGNVRGLTNNNKLEIKFNDCLFENNLPLDRLKAYGAYSKYSASVPIGSNNTATIHLRGISVGATNNPINSYLNDFDNTNTAKLVPPQ